MMSLHAIHCVNQEIAERASQEDLVPYRPFTIDEIDNYPPIPCSNLGHFRPDGWEEDEGTRWLVDKTGHGCEWEPALTVEQFKRVLREYLLRHSDAGFAIVEEGECQAVVSAFLPIE